MTEPQPSSVFVQFFGICTHISADALEPPATDWNRRAVLVNASQPHTLGIERLRHLEPHLATLQIPDGEILSAPPPLSQVVTRGDLSLRIQQLHGVTMTIENAVPATGAVTPDDCMPHLRSFVHPHRELGRASLHAYEKNPARTACFFDFQNATPVSGNRFGEAAVGVLQVLTSGNPILRITPFDTDLAGVSIELRPGARISVCNLPEGGTKDDVNDFLFHYLIVDPFPQDLAWPPANFTVSCPPLLHQPPGIDQITTAGCSNSNYP